MKESYNYRFTVPAWQGNATSCDYYRGDKNADWQVSLVTSSEGYGTVMSYWIEAPDNSNLTSVKNVKQGTGVHDYSGLIHRGNVHLASQNNNNSSKVNSTSGQWDEE